MTAITDRERMLRLVPEKDWTSTVVNIAAVYGWLVHHSLTAMMQSGRWATALQGTPGLPDLLMLRPPRQVVAELKRQHGGVLSPHQERWLAAWRLIPGTEVKIWRPGDIDDVHATLQRGQA